MLFTTTASEGRSSGSVASGVTGIEPATSGLSGRRSSIELHTIGGRRDLDVRTDHLYHKPAVTSQRVALPANVAGGDQSPGLVAQDLARYDDWIFPVLAERGWCWFQFVPPKMIETSKRASWDNLVLLRGHP